METSNNAPETQVSQQQKLGKFASSKKLAAQCYRLLNKDKEIIWFPIFSTIISTFIFAAYVVVILFSPLKDVLPLEEGIEPNTLQTVTFYGLLFVYYFFTYFIVTFFQVGLTAVVYERLQGGNLGFKDGISASFSILGKLFTWAFFASTVGIVLKVLTDKSKFLVRFVIWLIGVAWNLATFFIAPTLLLDNVGVMQSIKNSGNLFKKTWGETLILTISVHVFFLLFYFIIFFAYLAALISMLIFEIFSLPLFLVITSVVVITILSLTILVERLSSIFKVVLYNYARNGVIAEGFTSEFISNAIKKEGDESTQDLKLKKSHWYRYVIAIIVILSISFFGYYMDKTIVEDSNVEEDLSLLPKYGEKEKTKNQKLADEQFINDFLKEGITREEASEGIVSGAWEWYYQGDLETAMKRFNQAWLMNSNNPEVYIGFGTIVGFQGKTDEAITLFEEGLEYQSEHPILMCNLGFAYNIKALEQESDRNEYFEKSIDYFETANEIDSEVEFCHAQWAVSLYNQDKFGEAIEHINKSQKLGGASLDPDFVNDFIYKNPDMDGDGIPNTEEYFVYNTKINNKDSNNNGVNDGNEILQQFLDNILIEDSELLLRYKENISIHGSNSNEHLLRRYNLIANDPYINLSPEIDMLWQSAHFSRQENNYQESLDTLNKILDIDPNSGLGFHHIGLTYYMMKEYDKALEYYERAFNETNYKSPLLNHDLALTYRHFEKNDKAKEYLNKAIEIFPSYLNSYNLLADWYIDDSEFQSAETLLNKAISVEPRSAMFYTLLGRTKLNQNNNAEALHMYKKAVEIDMHNSDALLNLAKYYRDIEGDQEKALKLMLIADLFDENNTEVLNSLGLIYGNNKDFDIAIEYFLKSIEANPDFSRPLNNLGNTYLLQNRYDDAIPYLRKAIDAEPNWYLPYKNLGLAYFNQGNNGQAVIEWEKSIKLGLNEEYILNIYNSIK